jgi:predicted Fe-Mo cluster-binding NifX family protein
VFLPGGDDPKQSISSKDGISIVSKLATRGFDVVVASCDGPDEDGVATNITKATDCIIIMFDQRYTEEIIMNRSRKATPPYGAGYTDETMRDLVV